MTLLGWLLLLPILIVLWAVAIWCVAKVIKGIK